MPSFSFVTAVLLVSLLIPGQASDVSATPPPQHETQDVLGRCGDCHDERDTVSHGERLDRVEILLAQQAELLSSQYRLLRIQSERLSRQEKIIDVQSDTLSSLKELFRAQADRLSQQEDLISTQTDKLSRQQSVISFLSDKLSSVEELLNVQSAKLSDQESLLSHQDVLIQQLRSTVEKSDARHNVRSPTDLMGNNITAENRVPNCCNDSSDMSNQSREAGHDLAARADDADPLQAVVSQMDQRLTEVSADIQALRNADTQHSQDIRDSQTSTFVHWGSSQCSNSSQLVYSGVMGGSSASHPGGGTNYLCLTMSPVISDHTVPSVVGFLYGAEYETHDSHFERDAVCSVCRSSYSTTIMIPGTNVCTPGWHRQYSGYLMSGYYNHAAGSEFICVDTVEEGRPGTIASTDGKLLYFTATRCGTLPCDPYVNNKIVTCAVCSQ